MLILSRRRNESILIKTTDGEIEITVLDQRSNAIRIGINAPLKCSIIRQELTHHHRAQDKDSIINSGKSQAKEGVL